MVADSYGISLSPWRASERLLKGKITYEPTTLVITTSFPCQDVATD